MLSRQLRRRLRDGAAAEGAAEAAGQPPRKLARRAAGAAKRPCSTALRVRESALLRPVRAVGVVTDGVPVASVTLGAADFLVASNRRGFQIFDCKRLRLAHLGPRLNEKIRAILCVGEVILTALKADIVAWHNLTELGRFRGHTEAAAAMCAVGTALLVSASGTEVLVWPLSNIGLEPASSCRDGQCVLPPLASLTVGSDFGSCTAICHPPTYLHKVLLGGSSGELTLWNARTHELVHTFSAQRAQSKVLCAITCLREAPHVLDLAAVGFSGGRICVLHLREDRVVAEFDQTQGLVTALAFRSGPSAPAHLVSGTPSGAFVVWDLDKRRAHHVAAQAHQGPITSAHFLPGQPLLVTSGRDNAVRMWIFDTPDGLPRALRSRCGCPGLGRRMGFYGGTGDRELLVGGGCQGAGFVAKISMIQDHQNVEYSQAVLRNKLASFQAMQPSQFSRLPPVVDLAFCEVRHFDWPAVVTAHEGLETAFVWNAQKHALAPTVLRPPPDADAAPVTAVAVSPCGHYSVIGLESGALHRFNLQSGLYRGTIPKAPGDDEPLEAAGKTSSAAPRAHRGRVCGLEITVSGQVISCASHPLDCHLRTWRLASHQPIATVPLTTKRAGSPSCHLLRAQGSLVAVSLDDGALLVVDLHGMAVVRSFVCGVPATDLAFSAESRWLAAALHDGGLRVFDLPAARCVDSFIFARPALSLCFSPTTAFLLTSHTKGNDIQVWANKFIFDPSLSAPLLRLEPATPVHIDEPGRPGDDAKPSPAGDDGRPTADGRAEGPARDPREADGSKAEACEPLEPDMLTLSDTPPAKWLATLHLDLVKERNKPAEPPKPLPTAPFFLPTAHEGVLPRFVAPLDGDRDDVEEAKHAIGASRVARVLREDGPVARELPFLVMLREGNFDDALAFLRAQTPSGVHLAIEELGPLAGGRSNDLLAGLSFFAHHLQKAHFADEVQAYLSLFLQAHGEEFIAEPKFRGQCSKLSSAQDRLWTSLNTQCQKARCFLGVLTHTQSQW